MRNCVLPCNLSAMAGHAIVEGDRVYSLGNATAHGPIRCMCTNTGKTIGSVDRLSTVHVVTL